MCNKHFSSTHLHEPFSDNVHVPLLLPIKLVVYGIGSTMCAIHFRGPSIRQGSFNTLINGCLLLGTPTCCFNTWTLLMVSLLVHLGTLSKR